jgi:hypothetical protein
MQAARNQKSNTGNLFTENPTSLLTFPNIPYAGSIRHSVCLRKA